MTNLLRILLSVLPITGIWFVQVFIPVLAHTASREPIFFRLDTETGKLYNKNLKTFDFDFVTEYLPDRKKEEIEGSEKKKEKKRKVLNYINLRWIN